MPVESGILFYYVRKQAPTANEMMRPEMIETKTFHRNSRGAAAVEFAIVLPVLLLLVMGIIEFGLLMKDYLAVSHASREGARYAAVLPYDSSFMSNVRARVKDASGGITLEDSDITVCYYKQPSGTPSTDFSNVASGDEVEVTTTYAHSFVTGYIPSMVGTKILVGRTAMRRE